YRGMGSVEAMQEGSKDRYFQDVEDDIKKLVPEGIVGRVPYKGELNESMQQFIGGLRAGMGYCGSKDIPTLQETGRFVRITSSEIKKRNQKNEAITKKAPNNSKKKKKKKPPKLKFGSFFLFSKKVIKKFFASNNP